jgi:signal transduction histidine kinase
LLVVLFAFFLWLTMYWYRKLLKLETATVLMRSEKDAEMGRIASQVAHDIRSPVFALEAVLKNVPQLPERQRVIVRHAVNRIRDVANSLLETNRQQPTAATAGQPATSGKTLETYLLSSLIGPVISEKLLQYESRPGVRIDFNLSRDSYGLFGKVQPIEFRRMISNLINNAIEALGEKGSVNLTLTQKAGTIVIARIVIETRPAR